MDVQISWLENLTLIIVLVCISLPRSDFKSLNIGWDSLVRISSLQLLCLVLQLHECENLEFQAWDMITENFDSVSCTQEFQNLSPENLIEIIKYDDLQANEDEVSYTCFFCMNQ